MQRQLLALVLWALAGTIAQADEACGLYRLAELPMAMDVAGRPMVTVAINDKPVKMLIDTGGTDSDVTMSTSQALGLELRRLRYVKMVQFGGAEITKYAIADKVALDQLTANRMPLLVSPDEASAPGIEGTIAPNILSRYDAEFDFANAKFSLFSPKHCPGRVVHWTADGYAEVPIVVDESGHILAPVMIDGQTFLGAIDTGSSTSVLSRDLAERLFHFTVPAPPAGQAQGDGILAYRYPFKTLSLHGINVSNPKIDLVAESDSKLGAKGPQVILGMTILRQLHFYIAYQESKLYVTPASAH